nr:GDSL esterase/lipase At5g33370-like [Ipomoea batatas]
MEPTLPCLSPDLKGEKLLVGANFASAGVGILNDTGVQFMNIIRIGNQLDYFQEYQRRVSDLIGAAEAKQLVNKALVLITLGGNDFVNNYYLVPFLRQISPVHTIPEYVPFLNLPSIANSSGKLIRNPPSTRYFDSTSKECPAIQGAKRKETGEAEALDF